MSRADAQFSRVPGGKYRCRRNDDGTFDVFDVEFFSTIPKGVKGAPKDITADDLNLAVEVHRKKFTEDRFLSRLNVLHNFGSQKATPAGFFLPKRVGEMRLGGKTRAVIFADLISIPETVFQAIDRDELPYRSAEVREWEPLQFGALALLDTEPPFFEFPLLTTGEKVGGVESVGHEIFCFDRSLEPAVVAAFTSKAGSSFLFNFPREDSMSDEEKKNEEAQMEEGSGLDVAAVCKAIESGEIAVKDMDAIVAAVEAQKASAPSEDVEDTEDPPGQEVPVELSHDDAPPTFDAKAEGRLAALESKVDQYEKEKAQNARFGAAVKALEAEGRHVADSARDRMFKAAGFGQDSLDLLLDTFREDVPRDPGPTLEGGPADETFPSEVMGFANRGPDALAAAKQLFRDWNAMPDDRFRSPLENFLKREMRRVS